jgi:hypothetical protein
MGMRCEVVAIPAPQVGELVADPSGMDNLIESLEGSANYVSLEKSWHGLHYVLTRTAWEGDPPLNFLAAGGEPVGDDDGYGPARLLRNDDVRALNTALDAFTSAVFDQRFDLKELEAAEIYPQIWDESREDLLEEYGGYLAALKELVKRAAKSDQALLIAVR